MLLFSTPYFTLPLFQILLFDFPYKYKQNVTQLPLTYLSTLELFCELGNYKLWGNESFSPNTEHATFFLY